MARRPEAPAPKGTGTVRNRGTDRNPAGSPTTPSSSTGSVAALQGPIPPQERGRGLAPGRGPAGAGGSADPALEDDGRRAARRVAGSPSAGARTQHLRRVRADRQRSDQAAPRRTQGQRPTARARRAACSTRCESPAPTAEASAPGACRRRRSSTPTSTLAARWTTPSASGSSRTTSWRTSSARSARRPTCGCGRPTQLATFLDVAGDDRLHPLFRLASHSGARRSELLGLRWMHVDLDAATMSIAGRRTRVGYQMVQRAGRRPPPAPGSSTSTPPRRRPGGWQRPSRWSGRPGVRPTWSRATCSLRRTANRSTPITSRTASTRLVSRASVSRHPLPRPTPHARHAAAKGRRSAARSRPAPRPRLTGSHAVDL